MSFEESVKDATASFCENDYWKKVYEEAPKNAKKYLELTFYSSILAENDKEEEDGYDELRIEAEEKMTKADWEYLLENTPNLYGKALYTKKIEELTAINKSLE